MKKLKKLFSLGLALTIIASTMLPTSLFAKTVSDSSLTDKTETFIINNYHYYPIGTEDEKFTKGPHAKDSFLIPFFWTEEYAKKNGWSEPQPVEMESYRTSDDKVTYCLDLGKAMPDGTSMTYRPEKVTTALNRVIIKGYPNMKGEDYDISDAALEWATAVALKIVDGQMYDVTGKDHPSDLKLEAFNDGHTIEYTVNEKAYDNLDKETIAKYQAEADKILNVIKQLVAYSTDESVIVDNLDMSAQDEYIIPAGQTDYLVGPFNVSLESEQASMANLVVNIEGSDTAVLADAEGNELSAADLAFGQDFYIKGNTSTDLTLKVTAYASGIEVPIQYYYGTDEKTTIQVGNNHYETEFQRMYVYQTVTLQDEANINIKVTPARDLTITKVWEDQDNKYSIRPETININILQNGAKYRTVTMSSENALSTDENTWQVTVNNMPKYDSDGNPYSYTIEEDTSNQNIQNFYQSPSYNQETLTVINEAIFDSASKPQYTITFTKDIINEANQSATVSDFAELKLNYNDTYNFPIVLKELNKTVSTQNNQLVETYSGYSGNQFNGIVTNKDNLVFSNIPAGKYEISELAHQYFDFMDFEKLNSTSGASFSYENGKYYITISGLTAKDENISIKVINKIDSSRPYDEDDSAINLFKVESNHPV